MDFAASAKAQDYLERVRAFMDEHVYPNVETYNRQFEAMESRWGVVPILEELKAKATAAGLWNLVLPPSKEPDSPEFHGAGLTNREYAPLSEEMGKVGWGAEAVTGVSERNCPFSNIGLPWVRNTTSAASSGWRGCCCGRRGEPRKSAR